MADAEALFNTNAPIPTADPTTQAIEKTNAPKKT